MSAAVDNDLPRSSSKATRPEAMVDLPADNQLLVRRALEIIEICRADAGTRAAFYRQLAMITENGRNDGTKSLINMLYTVLDRLASFLFSPSNISFTMDFENEYEDEILARGSVAARLVAHSWERTNTDILFAQGVFEALKYGSVFLKQWIRQDGPDKLPIYHSSLVMPWQFGVYRPDCNVLDEQPAMVESVMLSAPEVWRRIYHMPDARKLFDRIMLNAAPGGKSDVSNSFFNQVLSTAPLQTGVTGATRPIPGGVVQFGSDPSNASINPTTTAPMVQMHELWVWDKEDYCTIQIIEPDILIAPRFKRSNLLIPGNIHSGLHPYTLIQPNQTQGNLWGRSELFDLIEPQNLLSTTAADIKRLFGVQVDKLLAFSGGDGLSDEQYDQYRAAGYMNLGPGGSVNDITPKFPSEALPLLDKLMGIIEMLSGFDNMLSGRGEPGVRSGVQSNPLMKAAGARLKDRSLIVERQCAAAADLRLSIMGAKDGRNYWTNAKKKQETSFLLSDLPDDGRVVVDGHTTSPIFEADHQALVVDGLKLGLIDPVSAIEQLPFQNKDTILARLRAKQEKEDAILAQLQKSDPDAYANLLAHGGKKK
jgi:hypothetical protein